jgi:2-phospho-L-lactate guanylyltransferase
MSSRVARSNIMSYEPTPWTVIVPVKELHLAKSRLGELGVIARRQLARAFALDTVDAALRCPWVGAVVVVTNESVGSVFRDRGCAVVPDVPDAGLNPALAFAGEQVRARSPQAALAAISSDLPSVRPDDLSAVLGVAPQRAWFVSDSHRIGTTMLGSPSGAEWQPAFGGASRAAHLERGNVEVDVPGLERLRLDVDTTADLETARRLGVGVETTAVLKTFDSLG